MADADSNSNPLLADFDFPPFDRVEPAHVCRGIRALLARLVLGIELQTELDAAVQYNATLNCANNTGAENLYIISVKVIKGRLNRLPSACVNDMVMANVKKGKPHLGKKVMPSVIVLEQLSGQSPVLSKGEFLKSDLVQVGMSIVVNIGGPNRNDIVLLQRAAGEWPEFEGVQAAQEEPQRHWMLCFGIHEHINLGMK
uniref:60S ribosomal protein L23 n=1 Tax=Aegilops tauschii TaxID=37682 RepID=M8BTJ6_AEGTA